MKLSEVNFTDIQPPIDSYGPGFFRVSEALHYGPLLLGPTGIIPWKGAEDTAPLGALSSTVDVLFWGAGTEIAPLPPSLKQFVERHNLALEIMSTPSACRTYNVLLSEGRRVGLAALIVDNPLSDD